jgi:drug/metabolite transporter (DMT)-like permease
MPTSALGLALAAACVHALWNVLLVRTRDPRAATAVALLVAQIVFVIPAALTWQVQASVWPFVLVSGILELAYFLLLVSAYLIAPLSVVYPIARGAAPVLVLILGVVALGKGTTLGQVLGVCLVGVGILLVRGTRPAAGRGAALGLIVACTIAGYTLVDKSGITHASAIPYLELSMILPTLGAIAPVSRARMRAELRPETVVAGIATFGAYCLVLLALQRASAASVAAVRETSVVIAALLARHVLRESVGWWRLAGAASVAGGIALLSLT